MMNSPELDPWGICSNESIAVFLSLTAIGVVVGFLAAPVFYLMAFLSGYLTLATLVLRLDKKPPRPISPTPFSISTWIPGREVD